VNPDPFAFRSFPTRNAPVARPNRQTKGDLENAQRAGNDPALASPLMEGCYAP
jgi:hypothetical protein